MPKLAQEEASSSAYLPPNDLSFFTLQMLKGDRRFICPYEGRDHIPYCLTRPLSREDCAPYLKNFDGPVTFTARVPLETVTRGVPAMVAHLQERAFSFPVELGSCGFRPVGACIEDFDC
jgi:hypothetical protein